MLAEVGDGSMRDALCIMDQAIACCGTTLSGDLVRGLVGTVCSDVLEDIMRAVAANSSEDVLRIVDRLLIEGHNRAAFRPAACAFPAQCLGGESRGQTIRVAADFFRRTGTRSTRRRHFQEEDLARFLQIMLRTHDELGYGRSNAFILNWAAEAGTRATPAAAGRAAERRGRQAERWEGASQKISEPGGSSAGSPRTALASSAPGSSVASRAAAATTPRPSAPPAPSVTAAPASPFDKPSPFSKPSPFDSDRSRKSEANSTAGPMPMSTPRHETTASAASSSAYGLASSGTATAVAIEPEPEPIAVVNEPEPQRAAPPVAAQPEPQAAADAVAPQPEPQAAAPADEAGITSLREAVLTALENAGQQVLAHNLEQGEWSMRGVEISVKVAMSQAMVDFALGEGPKRIIQKALTETSGKTLKFRMVSGGAQFTAAVAAPRQSNGNGGSARSRAMADPIVKQMQETFGAEIRTVIDLKQRG